MRTTFGWPQSLWSEFAVQGGKMSGSIREFRGGNMDIDLIPNAGLTWKRDTCPWNEAENSTAHKCAVKDTSICRYFKGIKPVDTVLCRYPDN
jgi:hypothetical protein